VRERRLEKGAGRRQRGVVHETQAEAHGDIARSTTVVPESTRAGVQSGDKEGAGIPCPSA